MTQNLHLDMIEERRERALIRLAAYQQQLARSYQKKVRKRVFKVGDLVLRKVFLNTKDPNHAKLGPTWDGPYLVTSAGKAGVLSFGNTRRKGFEKTMECSKFKEVLLLIFVPKILLV